MARGKKKENLTPEERLQAALVPDWEQPYKVPKNWCWVKVGEFSNLYRGVSYKKQDSHSEKQDQDYLILRGGNILEGAIDTEVNDNIYVNRNFVQDEQLVQPYDIIIVSSTGSSKVIGRAGISYEKYKDVAFGAFLTLVRPNNGVVKPFISYYFQSSLYRERIRDLASGVNINNIKASYITESPLPLPPLPEQQRIVDRIESLFAKLDEAKQKAQDALDSFETRKAAILHKAFTGELTAQWRKEHGVGMESWENTALIDVCILRSGTTIPVECELSNGNIPYVKVADMNLPENYLTIKTSSRFVNSCVESQIIPYGSTIFPKRGGAILTNKKRFIAVPKIIADLNIMAIIPNNDLINNWYCYYWMLSIDLRELNNGSNVPQINNKDMVKLYIPKPSLSEQNEIVRILDDLIAKEQQAKEAAENVLEQIDLIKKSILTRAFRGELGTNNPAEESSVELVKEIL